MLYTGHQLQNVLEDRYKQAQRPQLSHRERTAQPPPGSCGRATTEGVSTEGNGGGRKSKDTVTGSDMPLELGHS